MIRLIPHSRALTLSLVALLSMVSCTRKTEGGLLLEIKLADGVVASECLVLDGISEGNRLSRSLIGRPASRKSFFVGIARGDLPASLEWQVTAMRGQCTAEAEWKVITRSAPVSRTFPATGIENFEILVGTPDTTLDADGDGYVDKDKGGLDCDDTNRAVHPGVAQDCSSPIDTDCNGRRFCDDSACSSLSACMRPATGLRFNSTLATLVASDCSGPLEVEAVNAGMPASVRADTTVVLTPSGPAATGVEFFSDAACMVPATANGVRLPFGVSKATFSFRAAQSGSLTVEASEPMLGAATLTTVVTDRPVAKLRLAPTTLTTRAGDCSQAIEVTALDDRMLPTNVSSAGLPLSVNYNPPGTTSVTIFTDASCTVQGTPSISAGTSSTRFWLRGSRVTQMPVEVQVSSPSVDGGLPVALSLTVTAGAAAGIEFTNARMGIRTNTCNPVAAVLQVIDANGNPTVAPPGGIFVLLSVTPPAGGTLSTSVLSSCTSPALDITIPEAANQQSVYLRADLPGSYQLSATASALTTMPSTQLQVDAATMNPTALVFSNPAASAATLTAGGCSPLVRLTTREMNSLASTLSPVPSLTTVTVEPSPAGSVTLHRDATCQTAPIANNQLTLNAGTSEVTFYVGGSRANTFTLTASAQAGSGLSPSAPPQSGAVKPAMTFRMVFQAPTNLSATAGACSAAFSLRAFDAFDNPTFADGTITPASTPGGVLFANNAGCTGAAVSPSIAVADGGVSFFATADLARSYGITVTGLAQSAAMPPATLTVTPGVPSVLRVITQPPTSLASGSCVPVTIEQADARGNATSAATAQPYTVAVNTATIATVHDNAACTTAGALSFPANMSRSTFYVRAVRVGSTTFTASGTGTVSTSSVAVSATNASQIRFRSGTPPASGAVGVCNSAVLERLDPQGNLTTLGSAAVTVDATDVGSGNGLRLNAGNTCGSNAATSVALAFGGSDNVTFAYEPRAPGTLTFNASGAGLGMASANTSIAAGGVASLRYTAAPTGNQAFGSCLALTLEALDVGLNRVTTPTAFTFSSTGTGTFYSTPDCSGGPSVMGTVPAGLTATGSYRPTALGMATLSATAVGATAASTSITVIAGAEATLGRAANFAATTTAGTCVNFTVRRVDSGGNDAVGGARTVTIALSGAASVAPREALRYAGHGCANAPLATPGLDIAAGASSVDFSVRVRTIGALTLSTTTSGITSPADTSTTVVAGALASLSLVPDPPAASLQTNTCSPVITVNGFDAESNPAPLGTQALSMANSSFFSDAACASGIANLAAGAATTATFRLRSTTAGTVALQVGGSTLSASQMWTITAPPVSAIRVKAPAPSSVVRFACSGPYRIETSDGTIAVVSGSLRTVTFAGTGLQYFSDAVCSTPITDTTVAAASTESAEFYFVALSESTATFDATTPSLTAANLALTVTGTSGARDLLVTLDGPDLEYRGCVGVNIDRRAGGSPLTGAFTTQLSLSLSGGGASGVTLHSDNACASAGITTATIGATQSTTKVYLKGHSAEPATTTVATASFTATDAIGLAGFGSDSETMNVHPAVRRGTCSIAMGQQTSTCTIQPPLPPTTNVRNRTFFTFQAALVGETASASTQHVRCWLNGTTALECDRSAGGVAVDIAWEVLSFGVGGQVFVQHLEPEMTNATTPVPLPAFMPVPRANTFVLTSHQNSSAGADWDDYPTVNLDGGTHPTNYEGGGLRNLGSVQFPVRFSVQIVTWSDVLVLSGVLANGSGNNFTASASALPAGTTTALLFSSQLGADPGGNSAAICRYRMRGRLGGAGNNNPTFFRGVGANAQCDDGNMAETVWSRLSFTADAGRVSNPGVNGMTIANGRHDVLWQPGRPGIGHRSWTFISGQGPGGQATGETNRGDTGNENYLGYTLARLSYEPTSDGGTAIRLVRGVDGGSESRFQPYLVELPY